MSTRQIQRFMMLAAFLTLMLPISSSQADTITVGTHSPGFSGENCIPFGCPVFFSLTRYQQVYSASAFPGPIEVLAISFFNSIDIGSESNTVAPATYAFSFSTTTKPIGGLDRLNLDNNVGPDSQAFFSGHLGGPLPGTEFTVTGTMPFEYIPFHGNLLLDIAISGAGPDTSTFFDSQAPSVLFSRTFNGQPPNEETSGLVTGFQFTPVPEPRTIVLLGVGLVWIALTGIRRRRART